MLFNIKIKEPKKEEDTEEYTEEDTDKDVFNISFKIKESVVPEKPMEIYGLMYYLIIIEIELIK